MLIDDRTGVQHDWSGECSGVVPKSERRVVNRDGSCPADTGARFERQGTGIRGEVSVSDVRADNAELVRSDFGERKACEVQRFTAAVRTDVKPTRTADACIGRKIHKAKRQNLCSTVVHERSIAADTRSSDVHDFRAEVLAVDVKGPATGDVRRPHRRAQRCAISDEERAAIYCDGSIKSIRSSQGEDVVAGFRQRTRAAEDTIEADGEAIRVESDRARRVGERHW